MRVRKTYLVAAAAAATAAWVGNGASAMAAFPNFSDCPRATVIANTYGGACIDIQSNSGSVTIQSTTVPLDHSLEIRGGLLFGSGTAATFVAGTGNGFFAQPVNVPGGLLGINLPIPGNAVTATATLVGPSSGIVVDTQTQSLQVPIKLKLSNPLLASGCEIGSNSNPVQLNLTTGTTSPPPPNTPISGYLAPVTVGHTALGNVYIGHLGNINVDNSFSVPGADGCGWLGLGLIDAAVDLKLGLPSAGGNNSMTVNANVGQQSAYSGG